MSTLNTRGVQYKLEMCVLRLGNSQACQSVRGIYPWYGAHNQHRSVHCEYKVYDGWCWSYKTTYLCERFDGLYGT